MRGVYIALMIFVIIAIVCFPLLGIWSLNTLFACGIPYTWSTWAAMLVLVMAVGSCGRNKND